VKLETLCPDIGGKPYLEFGFGEGWKSGEGPRAILSTLVSGDMKLGASGDGEPGAGQARPRLLGSLGLEPSRVLSLHLAHSRRVVVLAKGEEETFPSLLSDGADGLVVEGWTAVPALTVADCMPIWLFDSKRGSFGVLHSGWRGTGILGEALKGMAARFGSEPGDVAVILGPSIGACCYAVPEERAEGFMAEFGESSVRLLRSEDGSGTFHIDLRSANIALAERLGIGRLLDLRLCTSCSPFLGSYRRQGASGFTRMLALCGYF